MTLSETLQAISTELTRNAIPFCITAEFTYRLVILRRYLLIEEDREFVFDHLVVKEEYKEYGETLLSRVLDAGNLLAGADPGYLEEWTGRLGVRLPE